MLSLSSRGSSLSGEDSMAFWCTGNDGLSSATLVVFGSLRVAAALEWMFMIASAMIDICGEIDEAGAFDSRLTLTMGSQTRKPTVCGSERVSDVAVVTSHEVLYWPMERPKCDEAGRGQMLAVSRLKKSYDAVLHVGRSWLCSSLVWRSL